MNTLLFIDDDKEMLNITSANFRELGFKVFTSDSVVHAIEVLNEAQPDCILLDVMMPKMDGFQGFSLLREKCQAPIIFVTGKISEDDKVKGLMMGADDYIEKPFSVRELHARILTSIRRFQPIASNIRFFSPLEIDIVEKIVYCNGEKLQLTAREYEILYFFVTNKGELLTYEAIGSQIWGTYQEADRASIMVNVSRLRKKLSINILAEELIETVWGKGYCFVGKETSERYEV